MQEFIQKIETFLKKSKHPLIVVCGPTASGKSKLGVSLAKKFNGEIISADSRQVYTEIKIGNDRISKKDMQSIPHHLIAYVKPNKLYNVAHFKKDAEKKIEEIYKRKHVPFLVGGTGLYIDAVCKNYQIPFGTSQTDFRKKMKELSIDDLLKKLKEIDSKEYKKQQSARNKQYIIRAIEIHHQTGKSKSKTATVKRPKYKCFYLVTDIPRETLYQNINKRVLEQIDRGLMQEVASLIKKYDSSLPSLTSIGCKEVVPYLNGEISKEEMIATLQKNTRNYAKRQVTWFKRYKE